MGFNFVPWPIAAGLAQPAVTVEVAWLLPRWRGGTLLVSALLFTGFSIILAITWWRGIDVTCGCFGTSTQTASNLGVSPRRASGYRGVVLFAARSAITGELRK
jgi:hypothetical protein